jgi:hypothetical protein
VPATRNNRAGRGPRNVLNQEKAARPLWKIRRQFRSRILQNTSGLAFLSMVRRA